MRLLKRTVVCLLVVSLLLAVAACNKKEFTDSIHFVEASDLAELMQDPDAVVIDARPAENYGAGHLENAINLPPSMLSVQEPVANLIAPQEEVEKVLGQMGISNQSKLYIYDHNAGVNASRVWWTLKAYGHENAWLINHGEAGIVLAGLPVTGLATEPKATTYTAKALDQSIYATIDEVKAVSEGRETGVIIDVRTEAEFAEGAIPKAILYPHTDNLYENGRFKSGHDILLDYMDEGVKLNDNIIVYCKTSYRAAQTYMLLKEAGFKNVQVYDGAWVEWSTAGQTPDSPTPTNEAAPTTVAPSQNDGS